MTPTPTSSKEITETLNTGRKQGEVGNKKPPKEYQWKPGESGNPEGKPLGAVSPITKVKQFFRKNPKEYKEFIEAYIKDPANRKHIVEMIDPKPKIDIGLSGQIEEKQIRELILTTRQILELPNVSKSNDTIIGEESLQE